MGMYAHDGGADWRKIGSVVTIVASFSHILNVSHGIKPGVYDDLGCMRMEGLHIGGYLMMLLLL